MNKKILAAVLFGAIILCFTDCSFNKEEVKKEEFEDIDPLTTDASTLDDLELEALAQKVLDSMTLEEKVGQMFIVSPGLLETPNSAAFNRKEVTQSIRDNLAKFHVGGVLFGAENIVNKEQTVNMIEELQRESKMELFICVDEEGGQVSRLANKGGMGVTPFPTMSDIGAIGDLDEAYNVGNTIGRQIKELGFNFDFAPVADVNTNPDSPEIGARSFSDDPELVSQMVVQVVNGLQSNDVSATLKHFPGQGDSIDDTHKGYANVSSNISRLRSVEFEPFKAGIDAKVDAIMMAHISVSEVTEDSIPASLSELMVSQILRNELGYNGIIVTDAMNMAAITRYYQADEAAVLAVKAGNDVILEPDNLEAAYYSVLTSVRNGEISEDRINASVIRILKVKIKRGVIPLTEIINEGSIITNTENSN